MNPLVVLVPVGLLALTGLARARPTSGPYAGISSRALTQAQAIEVLRTLDRDGAIHVKRWPSPYEPTLSMRPEVGDVRYTYLGKTATIERVDPRFAVFLARLARFLRERGVTEIRHLGIYPGRADDPDDVHNHGRAIDLASFAGNGIDLSVKRDWGDRPAPYGASATKTSYRLRPGDRGYVFFRDLYDFLARETSDREVVPAQGGPPTSIGDHSMILHPDFPDPTYRPQHQDHLHAQIGKTHGKDPTGT